MFVARASFPGIAGHGLCLCLAAGVVILPVSAGNFLVTGDLVLVSFQGG